MAAQRKGLLPAAGLLLVVSLIYTAFSYNRLVKQEEAVKLAWSELQNLYGRRADMVPTLVTIVQGAAAFEQELLREVTEARSRAGTLQLTGGPNAENYRQQEGAQAALAQSMNRVIAVVEAYPDLKATKNFIYLQAQLEGTERRIKVARKDFNAAVQAYNALVRQFPSSLTARTFGFREKEGFRADAAADTAPEVTF